MGWRSTGWLLMVVVGAASFSLSSQCCGEDTPAVDWKALADGVRPQWVDGLKSRVRSSCDAGKAPRFELSALKALVTIKGVDEGDQLHVVLNGGGKMNIAWAQLEADDLTRLAMTIAVQDEQPEDYARAAFFLLAGGQRERGLEYLGKAGSAGKPVEEIFASLLERVPAPPTPAGSQTASSSSAVRKPAKDSPWPFDPLPLKDLRASTHKVFAHYFTPYPISIDNRDPAADYYAKGYLDPEGENGKHRSYGGLLRDRPLPRAPLKGKDWAEVDMETEVRHAAAIGLDGFCCDLLSDSGQLWQRTLNLMEAAARVDPGFRIMLMPDMEAVYKGSPEKLKESIKALGQYPAAMRLEDGRLVLAPYNAQNRPAAWWKDWLAEMKKDGLEIAFLPLFQGWERYAKDFAPISAGFSDWGWRSPEGNRKWRSVPAQVHKLVPIWMAPVAPQDMRPRSGIYWEAGNSENYRVMWETSIEGGADWVQLITWNDYSENAHVAPSLYTQWAIYDLTAYYVNWFKSGHAPAITQDVLYYFYRNQPTSAAPNIKVKGSEKPRDEIELLAFLTQPGTLEVEIAGQKQQKEAPAGITSFKVPLVGGKPEFRLLRAGKIVVQCQGAFEITDKPTIQDLLYRGGSSSRPVVTVP